MPDPGQLARRTLPTLGRIRARRDDPGAGEVLDQAWRLARRNGTLPALGPAGLARIEWCWLAGRTQDAREQVDVLLSRTDTVAGLRLRGELLRYLQRAGWPAEPFPGCPPEWAAGLRGDWREAAATFARIGDPYEEALELGVSGDVPAALSGLATLDRLGAVAAARWVRSRLRALGVARIPRGRQPTTRANPEGLTTRQLDVLALLADGLTNAEIAARLVVSTRTVDHHVSAILATLGVTSRREAARRAQQLDLAGGRPRGG
jgi:DNA-binding CsgD family transcriptional regulator